MTEGTNEPGQLSVQLFCNVASSTGSTAGGFVAFVLPYDPGGDPKGNGGLLLASDVSELCLIQPIIPPPFSRYRRGKRPFNNPNREWRRRRGNVIPLSAQLNVGPARPQPAGANHGGRAQWHWNAISHLAKIITERRGCTREGLVQVPPNEKKRGGRLERVGVDRLWLWLLLLLLFRFSALVNGCILAFSFRG